MKRGWGRKTTKKKKVQLSKRAAGEGAGDSGGFSQLITNIVKVAHDDQLVCCLKAQ